MRTPIFALAACAGLIATAAFAGAPDFAHYATPASASGTNQSTNNDPNPVLCRTISHNGTVLSKPVCMTRESWDRMQQNNADSVRQLQLRSDLQSGTPR